MKTGEWWERVPGVETNEELFWFVTLIFGSIIAAVGSSFDRKKMLSTRNSASIQYIFIRNIFISFFKVRSLQTLILLNVWQNCLQPVWLGSNFLVSFHNNLLECWPVPPELVLMSPVCMFCRPEIRALWRPLQHIIFVGLKPLWN